MKPSPDEIRRYYDSNIADKIRDYVEGNDRVECAWRTVVEWAPSKPRRILEIGCGVGHVTARMGRRWPDAEITALDISRESIRLARLLFGRPRTTFLEGSLGHCRLESTFDLILLMDVYEHIAADERQQFHAALKQGLGNAGRVIVTCPTPRVLEWSRRVHPEAIQPIDEDVDLAVIQSLAIDLDCRVVHYREVDVWHVGDYSHTVLERSRPFGEDAAKEPKAPSWSRALSRLAQKIGHAQRRTRVARVLRGHNFASNAD